jgi:polar amino acid transport system substrate-binding protein
MFFSTSSCSQVALPSVDASVLPQSMKSTFLFLIVTLCLLAAGCSRKAHDKLIVGMELAYPPFEMTDEKGNPTGVSVDLALALGKFLNREVEIQNIPFDGLIPALKTGKIDLIISSMTETPERAQSIDFSAPYLKTGLCLLVNKNATIQSIQDLDQPGKTVAVKKGTTGHTYATQTIKQAKVLVLDKESACVLEVVQGKADAFIYDQMSTYQNWKRNEDSTRPILKPFKEEAWAIGIQKGNTELRDKVNAFLLEFRAGNGFDQLGNKYLKDQKEAFSKMGFPFYF